MNTNLQQKYSPVGTSGRPKNVTETSKRKAKPKDKASSRASTVNLNIWANSAQAKINDIINNINPIR